MTRTDTASGALVARSCFPDTDSPSVRRWRSFSGRCGFWVIAACALFLTGCSGDGDRVAAEVFTVRRGDLAVTVVESGSLDAAESLSIASEISKTVRIVELIDEGTSINEADVAAGKILVRMDTSELEDELYEMESNFESAQASLTEAKEAMAIQTSQNESSIRSAELSLTFAMSDLSKLVGDVLAGRYLVEPPEEIAALLEDSDIGGQARQDLRQLQSDIKLATINLKRAEEKVTFTRRLYEKEYVSKNELEGDELEVLTSALKLETSEAKLDLFRRYEFVKDFQKTWSTVIEAREKLDRERAIARSKLAQSEAQLSSRQASFQRAKTRLENHRKDIQRCTIQATRPGFVVYKQPPRWRNEGPIRVGSEIRPKTAILELPDLSRMVVSISVHEAMVDTVTIGQSATIAVDALPDRTFTGKVSSKAVLASSQSRWLNPDLKVYETKIAINEQDGALRPGMTATVEILVERLEAVVHVPIQSVQTSEDGQHYCLSPGGERVPVEIGKRNQIFVVIESGLSEGDRVLMSAPMTADGSR